ncbi:putative acetyltransferase involved in intracellular survival [Luteitalea pratensis]|uniref:Putative acetyltransferase involved in intracellular survival n=2 Tax=Luteitalea pratensis TaxID=1855912 RepID=A0A143PKK1_LUTPR|nr:putative acetyltransferase involved in intracellular survival [Luteitalea pratensis]
MTRDDVDAGLRLCRLSHWNQLARDWEQFLRLTPDGATVATDEAGVVIGSVATVRYAAAHRETETMTGRDSDARHDRDGDARLGRRQSDERLDRNDDDVAVELARRFSHPVPAIQDPATVTPHPIPGADDQNLGLRHLEPGTRHPVPASMAWIAMVLVDPAHRGSGIGTALLRRGLAHVADVTTVGLDATPLGRPLYEALGFRADTTLTRMRREPAPVKPVRASERNPLSRVRRATSADHDAIALLDGQASGLDRGAMLAWLHGGAPELAWVYDGAGGIEGAVLGRPGYAAIHLGPVIAPTANVAAGLVRAVLSTHGQDAVMVDVADDRAEWRQAVEALGFQAQRPFTRMYRGQWRPPADLTRLFAIIGPEFG